MGRDAYTHTSLRPFDLTAVARVCSDTGRFIAPADSDLGVAVVWICLFLLLPLAPRFSAQSLTRPLHFTPRELDSSWRHNNTLGILPNYSGAAEYGDKKAKQIWDLDCNTAEHCKAAKLHEHVKTNMEA